MDIYDPSSINFYSKNVPSSDFVGDIERIFEERIRNRKINEVFSLILISANGSEKINMMPRSIIKSYTVIISLLGKAIFFILSYLL